MKTSDGLVGIVELGSIGGAVADHVLASGRPMVGWARRRESLDRFAGRGGHIADSLAGLGAAEVLISVVFDDMAVRQIAFGPAGIIQTMSPGATHVAMGNDLSWPRSRTARSPPRAGISRRSRVWTTGGSCQS